MAARHRPGVEAPALRVVTVTNLKGGSGKSTTAGLLIHAWAQLGRRVVGVDADPQGTLTRWAEDAEWSVPVFGLATPKLHRDLPGIISPERFDLVVIDTPPLEQERGIVHSAMRAGTDVVVTLAPTASEWDALPRVWDALEDVDSLRDRPSPVSVLWNRVRANTTAARVYRELLAEAGHYCLRASIPLAERYAQAVGAPVHFGPTDTAIVDAAEEITKRGGWA
jgi:chromosome partitioning protein